MNDLHYAEDTLIDFLVAPDEVPNRAEIEEHLAGCASCSEVATSFAQFSQSLSDDVVWEGQDFSSALSKADESGLEGLVAYSRKLDNESAEAERHIATLMSLDPAARRELIEMSAEMWTVGVARELCERAHQAVEKSPADAVHLAELAIHISDRLPVEMYQPATVIHLRGRARKESAQALKFVGCYPEALQALDAAQAIYASSTVVDFDLAVLAYVRATVLRDLNELNEALTLAQRSARVFAEFGHQQRYRHARLLEAAVYYDSSDIRHARDVWMEQLHLARAESDLYSLGMLLNNVGNCYAELGDADTASSYLLQAISVFKELDLRPSALRSQWTLGRMLITNRKFSEGLTRLRAVHEEYEQLNMIPDAGVVALDMVEGLLASDKPEEAAVICRYLAEQFTACGMSSNAITAVSYLREAMAAGKATPVLVKHVRNYVAELPHEPELLFLPLPV